MVAHGIRKAIVDTIQYIYNRKISPRLPHTRPAEYNSVRVAEHRPATDWWVPFDTLAIEEKYKESNIQAIQETIEAGDRVAIIGGGYGVTAVVAARQAGESGEIQIYEAAKKRVQYIKQTLMLNNVSASVDHAVVGPINHISEELGDPTKISPENIGKFDVMEMDCEGAEVDVLQNLKTKPNAIIVETHGFLGTPSAVTEELLSNNGYKIDWKRPVDEGKKYSEKNDAYVIKSTR
jgi:preprotein translocase subunit YajC